jgi:hypothetical protein
MQSIQDLNISINSFQNKVVPIEVNIGLDWIGTVLIIGRFR